MTNTTCAVCRLDVQDSGGGIYVTVDGLDYRCTGTQRAHERGWIGPPGGDVGHVILTTAHGYVINGDPLSFDQVEGLGLDATLMHTEDAPIPAVGGTARILAELRRLAAIPPRDAEHGLLMFDTMAGLVNALPADLAAGE